MNTPSSQTYTDAYAEIKKLNEQITLLKQDRDVALTQEKEAMEAIDSIEERITQLDINSNELSLQLSNNIDLSQEVVTFSKKVIDDCKTIIDDYVQILKNLDIQIDSAQEYLVKIFDQCKEQHRKNLREQQQLELEKHDLVVNQKRVEDFIINNNLDLKIL